MTAALPPDGKRDNGLPSAEWGALVDLDPRLSSALLESLAAEGVPAYVEPAHDVDSYTRATTLPKRPLDRLWVDPSRADQARGVVASEVADLAALLAESEPGATADGLVRPVPRTAAARVLPPPDLSGTTVASPAAGEPRAISPLQPPVGGDALPSDEEIFRQIVSGFSSELDEPVPRWPVSEDLDVALPPSTPRRRRGDRGEGDGLPSWVEPAALEDDGHYEPPPPPRIPRPKPRILAAVAMIALGFLALFAPGILALDSLGFSLVLGLALTLGGAAILVMSMRDAPPTDSGPDDGAVV